jgi:hypothetical protein
MKSTSLKMSNEEAEATFDTTLERYRIGNFKVTNAKRVPYEELDYGIYKASSNQVIFQMNEVRLPLWIKALHVRYQSNKANTNDNNSPSEDINAHWEEHIDSNIASKCEKITLELSYNKLNIISITVSTLTGRIQIQGRFIKEWGDSEFGILLHMVSNVNDMKSNNPSKTTFLEAINKKLSGNLRASSSSEASISREQTFSMIKTHLAALEADFVTYKEENNKTVQNLTEIIEMKDTEINALKEEIMLLKKNNDEKQQLISDLTVKQLEIEEKISSSTKEQKKQFERNTNMITSLMKKQDTKETPVTSSNNNEELPATSCNSPQTSITIPTSNQFDIFNEISNPTTNQSLPELPKNPPTESNPQTPTKPPPTTYRQNIDRICFPTSLLPHGISMGFSTKSLVINPKIKILLKLSPKITLCFLQKHGVTKKYIFLDLRLLTPN